MDRNELDWAAGVIEGEGCIQITGSGGGLGLRVTMVDGDVVAALRDLFGGTVYALPARGRWSASNRWSVYGAVAANTLRQLLPSFRGTRWRMRGEAALDFYEGQNGVPWRQRGARTRRYCDVLSALAHVGSVTEEISKGLDIAPRPASEAWLAGLLEAEGTLWISGGLRVRINMVDADVIRTCAEMFGGAIARLPGRGRRRVQACWTACGQTAAAVLRRVWPHLRGLRWRLRTETALEYFDGQKALPLKERRARARRYREILSALAHIGPAVEEIAKSIPERGAAETGA